MKFYIYRDTQGYWRWRLVAGNNRIIADSGESYIQKEHCLQAIGLVMDTTRATPIYDA
jgi:uncharacterized protein YegP (UPF0339 family)